MFPVIRSRQSGIKPLSSIFYLLVSGFWFLVSGFWFLVSGFLTVIHYRREKLAALVDICVMRVRDEGGEAPSRFRHSTPARSHRSRGETFVSVDVDCCADRLVWVLEGVNNSSETSVKYVLVDWGCECLLSGR